MRLFVLHFFFKLLPHHLLKSRCSRIFKLPISLGNIGSRKTLSPAKINNFGLKTERYRTRPKRKCQENLSIGYIIFFIPPFKL